ncbi:hypothetical protein HN873_058260 [Arachis hypogaea]
MASLMKHDKCNRYISGGYCRGFLLGICLRSCDGPELKMDKSVATAESLFLQDRIDSNPDLHEVEVPVDRDILSQAADYLFIPSLLELTTNALANSVQTKLHPTAVWSTILFSSHQ